MSNEQKLIGTPLTFSHETIDNALIVRKIVKVEAPEHIAGYNIWVEDVKNPYMLGYSVALKLLENNRN